MNDSFPFVFTTTLSSVLSMSGYGLDQRLHDAAVPVVGGVAFLHVLPEVCQPHPHCGIPGVRCLESLLPGLQRFELLAVVVYLRVVVGVANFHRPFLLVQVEHPLL